MEIQRILVRSHQAISQLVESLNQRVFIKPLDLAAWLRQEWCLDVSVQVNFRIVKMCICRMIMYDHHVFRGIL